MSVTLPVDGMAEIRDVLIPVMRAIAATIGPRCEVVLHDIGHVDRLAHAIIWIENGHVTGRHVGGSTTNLGLEALRSGLEDPDRLNYPSRTRERLAIGGGMVESCHGHFSRRL